MTDPESRDKATSRQATPPPADAANTGGISGALYPHTPPTVPGTVADISTLASRPLEDLSDEQLLRAAPRMNIGERLTPALGGIPLLAKLGQGGMGAVYYGVHPRLHLEVAVKVLAPHLSFQSSSAVERFFREARTAARVKSPHLVAVLDVDEDQGLHFLVMEFIRGVSVGTYLKRTVSQGAPGLPECVALDIGLAAVQGLAAAHEEGIIHRDIKPDNILIPSSKDGHTLRFSESKLADLGLARGEQSDQGLTGSQVALGTPGYMAPEQAEDTNLTGKPADVFAVGATLYCLLAGRPPFTGTSFIKILMATAHEPHVPLSTIRPEISAPTVALIERCLSKAPQARHPDALALLEDLRACRAALNTVGPATDLDSAMAPTMIRSPNAPPPPPPPPPDTPPAAGTWAPATPAAPATAATITTPQPTPAPTSEPTTPPIRRGRRVAALLLLVLILAAVGAGGWLVVKERKARQSVAQLIEELKPAGSAEEAELGAAIQRIEDFQQSFRGRRGLLDPLSRLQADLEDRREQLSQRRVEFEKLVEQARHRTEDRPQDALASLDDAEDLGAPDEERAWPDLTADHRDELTEIRKRIEHRLTALAAIEDAAKRRQDFALGYQAGAGHMSRGELDEAVKVLEQALTRLGDLDHVARSDATGMLAKAHKEIERRELAAEQLKQAGQCLADGRLEEAARRYRQAKEIWPENPEVARVEEGLNTVADKLYAQLVDRGRRALTAEDWATAEGVFLAALKDRPDDAAAKAGLQEARQHSKDSRYSQAMEAGYRALQQRKWNDAGQAFQRALAVRKDDPAALQGVKDAQTQAREELFQGLLSNADQAVTVRAWDRAAACYKGALDLKRDDPAAIQGLQRATLRRMARFSLTHIMEGYGKVKGMRARAEAQLAPLIRQIESDRAEVARLSRPGRPPPGKKRILGGIRNFKQRAEAQDRLSRNLRELKAQSDKLKLDGTREILDDVLSAANSLAKQQSLHLMLQFENASQVNPRIFQRIGKYAGATTPEQMIAAFRRNVIVAAPQDFDPAAALIPGADLSRAVAEAEDVTQQLLRILNNPARSRPLKRP